MRYLLDTSVLILAIRNSSAFQVIDASLGLVARDIRPAVSIVTHGEILAMGKKRGWGAATLKQLQRITDDLLILPIDQASL